MSDIDIPLEAYGLAAHVYKRAAQLDSDALDKALEAAAPLIVASALDREADRIHGTIQAWGYGPNDDPPGNSIAGALCNVAVELRELASVLRGEGQT